MEADMFPQPTSKDVTSSKMLIFTYAIHRSAFITLSVFPNKSFKWI